MQERQDTGSDAAFTGASSNNQLVAAANPLLNAIPQIRHSVSHDDQVALRQRLIDEIRRFEVRCQQAGLPYEVIVGARYCLCTALDEAAALTPWGSSGVWSSNGLLVTFHNETWGGEKFFQLLARMGNVLFFQFAARVAVQVNADSAGFHAVQITPAGRIET